MAMTSKGYLVTGVFVIAMLVIFIKAYVAPVGRVDFTDLGEGGDGGRATPQGSGGGGDATKLQEIIEVSQALIKQRNELVQHLNKRQQKLGQIACEKAGTYREATSETGGWCKNSSKESSEHHMTDKPLAAALADFFKGKSVGSFGDGPGVYKKLLVESGKVKLYDAYDGAPYVDETTNGRVNFLDLTLPQFGLPLYDWVMSLEVAEHIPQQFERVYIDNLVRHARSGIVMSWARPGQGGYSHINNRPFDYVLKLFDDLGFDYDDKASQELRKVATLPWLHNNLIVFTRREHTKIDKDSAYFT